MDPVVLSMLTQRGFFHDAAALVLAVTALHQHIMQPQTLPSATEGKGCVSVLGGGRRLVLAVTVLRHRG